MTRRLPNLHGLRFGSRHPRIVDRNGSTPYAGLGESDDAFTASVLMHLSTLCALSLQKTDNNNVGRRQFLRRAGNIQGVLPCGNAVSSRERFREKAVQNHLTPPSKIRSCLHKSIDLSAPNLIGNTNVGGGPIHVRQCYHHTISGERIQILSK